MEEYKSVNLVLVRHGQSQWNLENRFTGRKDVGLTEKGEQDARTAGELLRRDTFDVAYTSTLKRAQQTLDIILPECMRGHIHVPVVRTAALNERSYGELEGLNKAEVAQQYSEEQVRLWRRSYDTVPPGGESLRDTSERVIPFFEKEIAPKLKEGQNVLVVAHGNSLRSLVMHLEHLSPEEIMEREIPTGVPLKYMLHPDLTVDRSFYLTEKCGV